MSLLDVNALVALVWDAHVHHAAIRRWFRANAARGWATCAVTESGFVRVSANPNALPHAIAVEDARSALAALREAPGHRFLSNDVSPTEPDVPKLASYRQVTDALLLTLARRHGLALLTFDAGIHTLAQGRDVELLTAG